MKVSMNKQELRLLKAMFDMLELNGELEPLQWAATNMGMSVEEFNQAYKTMAHKAQSAVGRMEAYVR
jgi:uncharacterized protein YoxC